MMGEGDVMLLGLVLAVAGTVTVVDLFLLAGIYFCDDVITLTPRGLRELFGLSVPGAVAAFVCCLLACPWLYAIGLIHLIFTGRWPRCLGSK